jgi:hypothetical protein
MTFEPGAQLKKQLAIIEAWQSMEPASARAVADAVGCSLQTAIKWCPFDRSLIALNPRGRPRGTTSKGPRAGSISAAMVRDMKRGMELTVTEMAARHRVTTTQVTYVRKRWCPSWTPASTMTLVVEIARKQKAQPSKRLATTLEQLKAGITDAGPNRLRTAVICAWWLMEKPTVAKVAAAIGCKIPTASILRPADLPSPDQRTFTHRLSDAIASVWRGLELPSVKSVAEMVGCSKDQAIKSCPRELIGHLPFRLQATVIRHHEANVAEAKVSANPTRRRGPRSAGRG